jgi:hypothetical protein
LRVKRAGYCAEITRSNSSIGHIFHYIVYREGSREILSWGQERTLKSARSCVNDCITNNLQRMRTGS